MGQYYMYGYGLKRDYDKAKAVFSDILTSENIDKLETRDHVMTAFYLTHIYLQQLGLNHQPELYQKYYNYTQLITTHFIMPFPFLFKIYSLFY